MKIKSRYKIQKDSDLLFAKVDISNILKKHKPNYLNFFTFAIMEIGTNILKHAKEGEIWLLEIDDDYMLAGLDEADGIDDISWAMKKGTTTYKNSLGLGLYQLNQNDFFELKVFTSTLGSVFLLKPKHISKNIVVFSQNYMDLKVSGDFFVKKGKYFLLGDVSGHGIKAHKSVEFIEHYFLNNIFSCVFIDDFFTSLHKTIKNNNLRGFVGVIGEINKEQITLCGVGNINIIYKKENVKFESFKEGIIGEAFSSSSKYNYKIDKNLQFFIFSDGIDEELMYNIVKSSNDIFLSIISAVYYSKRMDDKIILAIRG